jgi:hypothetical protein
LFHPVAKLRFCYGASRQIESEKLEGLLNFYPTKIPRLDKPPACLGGAFCFGFVLIKEAGKNLSFNHDVAHIRLEGLEFETFPVRKI